MPGTITPRQMFDAELNPRKGWPSPYAVDKSLPIYIEEDDKFADADSYMDDMQAGMVCHVAQDASTGNPKLRLGLPADGGVALFLFPNGDDYDVSGDVGNIIGSGDATLAAAATSGGEAGTVVALCALGAYELESTAIEEADVTTLDTPNLPITAGAAATADSGTNPGLIQPTTWALWRSSGTHLGVIGTVSDGTLKNEHNKDIVRFWPEHLPRITNS